MSPKSDLFSRLVVGPYVLPNRVFMAPLTRCRADADGSPGPLSAEYYAQRASAGLIVAEATRVRSDSVAYPNTPGIYEPKHATAWRETTRAVHAKGGRIFLQLWHVGRVAHPSFTGGTPVGPSAIAAAGTTWTPKGQEPFVLPHAMTEPEILEMVDAFRTAGALALEAGFDGVQIHGANGYLVDQFLRDGSNRRTDRWGGSPENRCRFLLAVVDAVADVWGPARVAVRLSPSGTFNDMRDSDPRTLFAHAVRELSKRGLAFLEIREAGDDDVRHGADPIPVAFFRPLYAGVLVANTAMTAAKANGYLAEGVADAASFGTAFLANPDLPERLRRGAPLNAADASTFYTPGPKGYVDYPALAG
ncbi:MAG TPA: alkene reductase [Planctomycetota bacterium]|nr:alkene reductase [Planctomycetota bacterium]